MLFFSVTTVGQTHSWNTEGAGGGQRSWQPFLELSLPLHFDTGLHTRSAAPCLSWVWPLNYRNPELRLQVCGCSGPELRFSYLDMLCWLTYLPRPTFLLRGKSISAAWLRCALAYVCTDGVPHVSGNQKKLTDFVSGKLK